MAALALLAAALLLLHPSPALANAAPLEAVGKGIAPRTDTGVRLVEEAIDAVIEERVVHVTADFHLRNEGPETTLKVGFPMGAEQPPSRFRVFVTGEGPKELAVTPRPLWYVWNMRFAAGEEVCLRVAYDQALGFGVQLRALFRYILRTGKAWMGTIGRATIRVRLPAAPNTEVLQCIPAGARVEGGTVTWEMSDFEPESDILVRWLEERPPTVLYTDLPLPGYLESTLPEEQQAVLVPLPGAVTVTPGEGETALGLGETTILLRGGQAVVNGEAWELPAPARVSGGRNVRVPLALLRRQGWAHARWSPEGRTLVVSSCGINWERWTQESPAAREEASLARGAELGWAYGALPNVRVEPELEAWHRTPRLATLSAYRAEVDRLESGGGQDPELLFRAAELRFYAGDILGAGEGFARCARAGVETSLAHLARFWEAQCRARARDYGGAVACLDPVIAGAERALADEARLQAASWLIEHDDAYALPPGTGRLAHARSLLEEVWQRSPDAHTAVRAGLRLARLADLEHDAGEAAEFLRRCARRSPRDPALAAELLARLRHEGGRTPAGIELELLVAHFPGMAETRLALMQANLRRAGMSKPAALRGEPRRWVERVLAAAPADDPDTSRFRRWARGRLGQGAGGEEGPTDTSGGALPASERLRLRFERHLKARDFPALHALLGQARKELGPGNGCVRHWEKDLALAEGRLAEGIELLKQLVRETPCSRADDFDGLDRLHAEIVETLLRLGRTEDAAQWARELLTAMHERRSQHHAGGYRPAPQAYAAVAEARLKRDPGDAPALALAALGRVPEVATRPDGLAPRIVELERLAARCPREPLAWAALWKALWVQHESDSRGCGAVRGSLAAQLRAGKSLSQAQKRLLERFDRREKRLLQALDRVLALDPDCPEVVPLLLDATGHSAMGVPLSAAGRQAVIRHVERYARRHPKDPGAWWALLRQHALSDGAYPDTDAVCRLRESLLQALQAAFDRAEPGPAPWMGDSTLLVEQYRALKRDLPPVLAKAAVSWGAPTEPRTPQEVSAAVARLDPLVLYTRHTLPRDYLALARLYSRQGRLQDAIRVYRLGRVSCPPDFPDSAKLREELEALLPRSLVGPGQNTP